jgi:predicted nucleotidyltransferase
VLRVLHGVTVPMNASRIAVLSGLSKPAVSTALGELNALGLVDSSPAGRSEVHWLVRENVYVREMTEPVFTAEDRIPQLMEDDLRAAFGEDAVSIVLFGSYARGEQDTASDVDVVLVGRDADAKAALDAEHDRQGSWFARRYGAPLSPLIYDLAEAADLWRRAPALLASLNEDGLVVSGLRPGEWRSHGPKE